jgi:hypothetical protein
MACYEWQRGTLSTDQFGDLMDQAEAAKKNFFQAVKDETSPAVSKKKSRTPAQLCADIHYSKASYKAELWRTAEDLTLEEMSRENIPREFLEEFSEVAEAAFSEYDEAIGHTATSYCRGNSHRRLLEAREEDSELLEVLASLESQWSEWTTEELEPPNEVEASSLRCCGPPSYLVYEVSHSLTNRPSGSQDKETVTV